MRKFSITKCFVALDIVLQVLLFSSHFGLLIWNNVHEDVQDKYFPEFGDFTLFVGIVSALFSMELDVFLLFFIAWKSEKTLYWWSFICLGLAILSWSSYIVLAITLFVQMNMEQAQPLLYLAIWAFFYLYSRATVVMIAKAEYLRMYESTKYVVKESISPRPIVASTESTPTTYRVRTKAKDNSQQAVLSISKADVTVSSGEDSLGINSGGSKMTFCSFLGSQAALPAPDHSMSRDEPPIKVNDEDQLEELKTKL